MSTTGSDTNNGGASAPVDDAVAGALLAVLAIGALVWFIPAHTDAAAGEYDVSPAFFPNLAATVLLALSVALALAGIARMRFAAQQPLRGIQSVGVSALLELVAWSIIAALAVFGLATIGFVATTAVLIAGGMLLAGRRTWWLIAAVAVTFPLLLDAAAWWIFTVDMP